MKAIRLRSYGDALGTTIDVEVHFAPLKGQTVTERLIQVATIIRAEGKNEIIADHLPCPTVATITRIETDFHAGHVTVSACVPEGSTAEMIQRGLLDLIPAK
jgi:hypothetical protein